MSDTLSSSVEVKPRFLRPVGRTTVIAVMAGVVIFLLVPGMFLLWQGISGGDGVLDRALCLLLATALLVIPGRIVFVSVHRKMTTGSWVPSDAERLKGYYRRSKAKIDVLFPWLEGVPAVCWSLTAAIAIWRVTHHPSHDLSSDEFMIACYLVMAMIYVRNAFRRWVG